MPRYGWQYASNGEAVDDPSITVTGFDFLSIESSLANLEYVFLEGENYITPQLIQELMMATVGNETNTN